MSTCRRCGETKPVDGGFYVGKDGKPRSVWCRPCHVAYTTAHRRANKERYAQYQRNWHAADPVRSKARRDIDGLRRMGLTPETYEALLQRQGRACAICGTDQPGGRGRWSIDHDHGCCPGGKSCGKCVRGLLCNSCNLGIGRLGDDPDRLLKAVAYLRAVD